MSEAQLKRRIENNSFPNEIRDSRINKEAFDELCEALVELATEWKEKREVDRELAGDLYTCVQMTQAAASRMCGLEQATRRAHPDCEVVRDMALELDRLVLECFASAQS